MQPNSTTATQPRTLIYCRVSGAGQEDAYSLPSQEAGCRRYCDERGYEVVEVFREVFTGTEIEHRPQLRALRERLRRGDITVVLCYDPDRASRAGLGPSLYLRESVKLAGARLEYVLKSYADDLSGDLLFAIDSWRAAEEVEKIRERTTRGKRRKAETGKILGHGPAPYGYRWIEERGKRLRLEEDPTTSPTLRRIFREVALGATLNQVIRSLNNDGIPVPGRSRQWSRSTVRTILHNPVYRGLVYAYRWQTIPRGGGRASLVERPVDERILIPNGAPALIDQATWDRVSERLAVNRVAVRRQALYPEISLLRGGHAICGHCGGAMTVRPHGAGWFYQCGRAYERPWLCGHRGTTSVSTVDQDVWRRIVWTLDNPERVASYLADAADRPNEAENELAAVEATLADLDRQVANLTGHLGRLADAAAVLVIDQINRLAGERERLASFHQQVARRVAAHQASLRQVEQLALACDRIRRRLTSLDYAGKRRLLAELQIKVKIYDQDRAPRWVPDAIIPLEADGSADSVLSGVISTSGDYVVT